MDEDTQTIAVNGFMDELKQRGIEAGMVRKDGILAYGTLASGDSTAQNVAAISNTTEGIMSKVKDSSKEIEIALASTFFVIIPIGQFLLCANVKDREEKKTLREYAEKIRSVL